MTLITDKPASKDINRPVTHTLTLKVRHAFNTLARIVGMFSGRGYSIDTITVGSAEDPDNARITITSQGDLKIIEQIVHQLEKLVDVIEVKDLTFESFVERELALIKVDAGVSERADITQVANIFGGKIVDISDETLTIEVTGGPDKVNAAITMFRPFGLAEVARTGSVAMKREYNSGVRIRI